MFLYVNHWVLLSLCYCDVVVVVSVVVGVVNALLICKVLVLL